MERKLLLYLAYDGSQFCGYQSQPNGRSVQQALNAAALSLFGYDCDITGCSRTDSGVHAHMYCATVAQKGTNTLSVTIPAEKIPRAINRFLPNAIAVERAVWVPAAFHPRYDVTSKTYLYRIDDRPTRSPFEAGRAWHYPRPLSEDNLQDMRRAAQAFLGEHDFSACMTAGSAIGEREDRNTVRQISDISLCREGDRVIFLVRGNGFLYNMVRIMVGTLIEVAEGRIPPDSVGERLASLDRRTMGRTAPPDGLYLHAVYYDDPTTPGYHGGLLPPP